MRCLRTVILITAFLILSFHTKAQSSFTDSTSLINTQVYFQNELKEYSHLYTGKEYAGYKPGVKGHPFFITDEMQNGDIFYDGTLYKNTPMLFDIASQNVIINRYNQEVRIQLLTEKIKYFTLGSYSFEAVTQAEADNNNISKGLYNVVYKGKASVLIKRLKRIKNGLRAEDPAFFIEEDELFIRNGKNLYDVSGKNAVMNALNDKKDLIKIFIRKNRLKFKKNIEKDLVMTVAYYSTLN